MAAPKRKRRIKNFYNNINPIYLNENKWDLLYDKLRLLYDKHLKKMNYLHYIKKKKTFFNRYYI